MKKIIIKLINIFFHLFKVNKRKILFECGRGMIDGSPRAIYNYMKEKKLNYKLVWIINKDVDGSTLNGTKFYYPHSFGDLYSRATAKYWIKSESIGSIIKKKKNQVYIQTFHGHGAMKKMGYDVTKEKNRKPLEHTKEWDYLLTNDPLDQKILLSSTGYQKETIMIGTPLTDYIYQKSKDEKFKKSIKEKLGITNNKPIILYAPTFRDKDLNKKEVNLKISCLKKFNDYNIILRLHPLVKNKVPKEIWKNSNIINGCNYPDSADILCITDLLITDYSSIIYEYAILERPILFYAYDLEEYRISRGFDIRYPEDLPGDVVYNEKELYEYILNLKNNKNNIKKLRNFNKKFNYLNDGNVCKKFVELLEKGYFK